MGCQWEYVHKRRFPPTYGKIAKVVMAMEPACAIFHGSRSFPVLWRLQLHKPPPVIAVQHGPSREITSWRRRQSCLIFSEQADRTVTVSDGMADLINRHSALADACRPLTVIPNGIDTEFWASAPPATASGGPARLVMAATLDKHKDHATLLRAVAALRDRGRQVACD
ncbi:MAG: glycosyltransferase, partial [Planctomycetota bacterium]